MTVYRLQSLILWFEGAFVDQEAAIKYLADQLMQAQPCKYPQVCRPATLKMKIGPHKWDIVDKVKYCCEYTNYINLHLILQKFPDTIFLQKNHSVNRIDYI